MAELTLTEPWSWKWGETNTVDSYVPVLDEPILDYRNGEVLLKIGNGVTAGGVTVESSTVEGIQQPSITSPISGNGNYVPGRISILTSQYLRIADVEDATSQYLETDHEVRRVLDNAVMFTGTDITAWSNALDKDTEYKIRIRYRAVDLLESPWSVWVTFTTSDLNPTTLVQTIMLPSYNILKMHKISGNGNILAYIDASFAEGAKLYIYRLVDGVFIEEESFQIYINADNLDIDFNGDNIIVPRRYGATIYRYDETNKLWNSIIGPRSLDENWHQYRATPHIGVVISGDGTKAAVSYEREVTTLAAPGTDIHNFIDIINLNAFNVVNTVTDNFTDGVVGGGSSFYARYMSMDHSGTFLAYVFRPLDATPNAPGLLNRVLKIDHVNGTITNTNTISWTAVNISKGIVGGIKLSNIGNKAAIWFHGSNTTNLEDNAAFLYNVNPSTGALTGTGYSSPISNDITDYVTDIDMSDNADTVFFATSDVVTSENIVYVATDWNSSTSNYDTTSLYLADSGTSSLKNNLNISGIASVHTSASTSGTNKLISIYM